MYDREALKQLVRDKALKFGDQPANNRANGNVNRPFDGAIGPDQLVVTEEKILALGDQGQFIYVLSLDTGSSPGKSGQVFLGGCASHFDHVSAGGSRCAGVS